MVFAPTPANDVNGVVGLRSARSSALRFPGRFSSSLLMSMSQPDQLACQAYVLPLFADGQRKLRIFDDHFELLVSPDR